MIDIDPQLMLLREIEARIAFAEFHIQEQRGTAEHLKRLGLASSLAHDLLRSMQDSLSILEQRRRDLLSTMQAGSPEPLPPLSSEANRSRPH